MHFLVQYYRFNDSMASGFTVCLEQGVLALFRYSLTLGPYTFIKFAGLLPPPCRS